MIRIAIQDDYSKGCVLSRQNVREIKMRNIGSYKNKLGEV